MSDTDKLNMDGYFAVTKESYQATLEHIWSLEDKVNSQQARIDALTGGIEELLKALEKRQYLSVPPEAWPDIAPAANRLYSILEAEK